MKPGSPRYLELKAKLTHFLPPLFPQGTKEKEKGMVKLVQKLVKAKITNEVRLFAFLEACQSLNQETGKERPKYADTTC